MRQNYKHARLEEMPSEHLHHALAQHRVTDSAPLMFASLLLKAFPR